MDGWMQAGGTENDVRGSDFMDMDLCEYMYICSLAVDVRF
jgi:hypothetical protein